MKDCYNTVFPALEDLPDHFDIESGEDYCTVKTPFRYPNDDYISIYVRDAFGDNLYITDFGKTFDFLDLYGVNLESDNRQSKLENIRSRFDLRPTDAEIRLRVRQDNLIDGILRGIQAIQAVAYIRYTHRKRKPSLFRQEVSMFLEDSGYRFDSNVIIQGQAEPRTFDFQINHRTPRVLLDTIHSTTEDYVKQQADSVLLKWYEINNLNFEHGVMVDDVEGAYPESKLETLEAHLDHYVRWSEKSQMLQQIPANVG